MGELIATLTGLVIGVSFVVWLFARKRSFERMREALEEGFPAVALAHGLLETSIDDEQVAWQGIRFVGGDRRSCTRAYRGVVDGRRLVVFTLRRRASTGWLTFYLIPLLRINIWRQDTVTVVALTRALPLLQVNLKPSPWIERSPQESMQMLGYEPRRLYRTGDKAFDRRCRTETDDPSYATSVLTPSTRAALSAMAIRLELGWRVEGTELVVWRPCQWTAEDFLPALRVLISIVDPDPAAGADPPRRPRRQR